MIINSDRNRFPMPELEGKNRGFHQQMHCSVNSQRLLTARMPQPARPLTKVEFETLLEIAGENTRTRDLRDIATVIFFTGLRPGEVEHLRWKDIGFGGRRMIVGHGKRGKRVVPFGARVLRVLELRRRLQPGSEPILGPNPRGALRQAAGKLAELASQARKEPINFQLLRVSFSARWLKAGGDPVLLAHIAGYSTRYWPMKDFRSPDMILAQAAEFQEKLDASEE